MSTFDIYPAKKPPQTELDAAIEKTEINNAILDARAARRSAKPETRRGHGRLAAIVASGSLLVGAGVAVEQSADDHSAVQGATAAQTIEHKAAETDPIQNGQLPTTGDAQEFARATGSATATPQGK